MNPSQGLLLKIEQELYNTFSNHFGDGVIINFIKHDCC